MIVIDLYLHDISVLTDNELKVDDLSQSTALYGRHDNVIAYAHVDVNSFKKAKYESQMSKKNFYFQPPTCNGGRDMRR